MKTMFFTSRDLYPVDTDFSHGVQSRLVHQKKKAETIAGSADMTVITSAIMSGHRASAIPNTIFYEHRNSKDQSE